MYLHNKRRDTFLLIALSCSIVLSYVYIDRSLAEICLHDSAWSLAPFFTMIKKLGLSSWYLIGSVLFYLYFHFIYKNKFYSHHALFLFSAVAVSGIVTDIIKVIAGRYRPSMYFEHGLYGFDFFHIHSVMNSFPSGHTTTAFALAMYIAYYWPKFSSIGWILAIAVGISRVALTYHYLSDVLAGAFIGIMTVKVLIIYWPEKFSLSKT
jgi:membrane-associated phospholipid phosphatase